MEAARPQFLGGRSAAESAFERQTWERVQSLGRSGKRGRLSMHLESIGRNKSSRSRAATPPTANRLNDFAKPMIAMDNSKAPFHFPKRKRPHRGADETLDKVFKGLLKEANRELASLLKDVRAGSETDLLDGAGS